MDLYVFPNLVFTTTVLTNSNLWMSKGNVDTLTLVTNFLNES